MAEKVSAPQSSTGILRFYDTNTGGPQLDPRWVIISTIAFMIILKVVDYLF
ncbi:MAG: hypothetical protein Sv326_0196 [Candidatus Fermentimicrarchaeum limneticum]|uniref:Preprotein translocase subunit Sec61beta n=1 Tax=Fermentimicrarchaeum limneticum TaxID=2795018 RepID=A0A7D5XC85_FERL1|nr:MAG: hypothetical protein Sv326_0196 [Candidatus Fermentimicrarchaeum limneticum]